MTFEEVVLTVCKHHQAYTLNGTFGEMLAFLEGYAKGSRIGSSGSCFSQYAEWLSERLNYPRPELWDLFRKRHRDDDATIDEFVKLWQEYESTHKAHT
jgi:hypothetical protein